MITIFLAVVAALAALACAALAHRTLNRTRTTTVRPRPRHGRTVVAGTAAGLLVLGALPVAGSAVLDADGVVSDVTSGVPKVAKPAPAAKPAPLPKQGRPALVDTDAPIAAAGTPAGAGARQIPENYQPPLNGPDPHGEGTVAVVDINPDPNRPQPGQVEGEERQEEVVVGRARGEEEQPGQYQGHIVIAALFGNEILGVETDEGESRTGPLEPVQQALLDPICNGSGNQICLEVLTADSTTTDTGSTNRFAVASAQLGGAEGLRVGAAESEGIIQGGGDCQTSTGSSRVADVRAGGTGVASVAEAQSNTRACKDGTQEASTSGRVITLFEQPVPIPAGGCGEGTPDVVTGIPTLAPIICNATDVNGAQAAAPYAVRDALTIFALATGDSALIKTATAESEALSRAPVACSDSVDNDGDGLVDFPADPGCTSLTDTSEENDAGTGGAGGGGDDGPVDTASEPACSDGIDNDGDGLVDFPKDPGCTSASDDSEGDGTATGAAGAPECSDGIDNDGDGRVDFPRDRGCASPQDDSEAGAAAQAAAGDLDDDRLPFTGAQVLLLAMGGLLSTGAGLALRRRTGKHGA